MPRRRLALSLLTCLTLGVVTTIAVAWGFALRPSRGLFMATLEDNPAPRWLTLWYEHRFGSLQLSIGLADNDRIFTSADIAAARKRMRSPQFAKAREASIAAGRGIPTWPMWIKVPPADHGPWKEWGFCATGWPLNCFFSHSEVPANGNVITTGELTIHGIGPLNMWTNSRTATVPAHPIWLYFLFDSHFFATAWYSLVFAPGALRRTIRARRGQCPHCAYDLRATPPTSPCPECGASIDRR